MKLETLRKLFLIQDLYSTAGRIQSESIYFSLRQEPLAKPTPDALEHSQIRQIRHSYCESADYDPPSNISALRKVMLKVELPCERFGRQSICVGGVSFQQCVSSANTLQMNDAMVHSDSDCDCDIERYIN